MNTWVLITISLCLSLDPTKIKYAVNCGGLQLTDSNKVTYQADKGFSSGIASDFGSQLSIKLTSDPQVYQTERYDLDTFSYKIPLTQPGNYVLILKFSQVYFNQPYGKIFDIHIGNFAVIQNLDIFSKVGRGAAYDQFIPFTFKENLISISDTPIAGAWQKGELVVKFVKGMADNPKVNAIVLLQGDIGDTDYFQQLEVLNRFEEAKAAYQKKIEDQSKKIKEIEEEPVEYGELDYEVFEPEIGDIVEADDLVSVLMTTPGLIFIFVCLVFALLFVVSMRFTKKKIN